MTFEINGNKRICSTASLRSQQRTHILSILLTFCDENPSATSVLFSSSVINVESVSMSWHHHAWYGLIKYDRHTKRQLCNMSNFELTKIPIVSIVTSNWVKCHYYVGEEKCVSASAKFPIRRWPIPDNLKSRHKGGSWSPIRKKGFTIRSLFLTYIVTTFTPSPLRYSCFVS